MAHRGRLNVLTNLLGKPLGALCSDFETQLGEGKTPEMLHVGDVKYHLGTHVTLQTGGGSVDVSMLPNPSHLEAVNAVVCGKARARCPICICIPFDSWSEHDAAAGVVIGAWLQAGGANEG